MNMNIVRSRNCNDVFAKRVINPNRIPLVQYVIKTILRRPSLSKNCPTNRVLIKLVIDKGSIYLAIS